MKVVMMLSCFVVASVAVSEEPITLCGRQLANARLLLCYGDIYEKRTYSQSMFDTLEKGNSLSEDWTWKGQKGEALSVGWNRFKRIGLADECCLKPCTTDVIRSYC